jgi:hypothetical protein
MNSVVVCESEGYFVYYFSPTPMSRMNMCSESAVRMQKCRLVLEKRNLNGMVTIFDIFSNLRQV